MPPASLPHVIQQQAALLARGLTVLLPCSAQVVMPLLNGHAFIARHGLPGDIIIWQNHATPVTFRVKEHGRLTLLAVDAIIEGIEVWAASATGDAAYLLRKGIPRAHSPSTA